MCCSSHVSASKSHNGSVNPEGGLSGRPPFMTLQTTVTLALISLKGRHPVRTCQEVSPTLLRVGVCTRFKNRHPSRIDIRTLGGKLFQRLSGEPKSLGVHQFRRHPPGRALQFTASGFLNNNRQPEVRYTSTVIRVYQDVGLAAVISTGDMFAINEALTPLMSPWTILCSCRNSNPVIAPTSYPNDQFGREKRLSHCSQDTGGCVSGWPR